MKDNECSGQPCISKTKENVEKNKKLVQKDRQISVRLIAECINIDKEGKLREDLSMTKNLFQAGPKIPQTLAKRTVRNVERMV